MSRIVWDILRGSVTILEAFIMTHFVFGFQRFHFKRNGRIAKYTVCVLVYSFMIIATYDPIPSEWIKGIMNIGYFFIISLLLIEERMHIQLLAAVVCVIVDMAVHFVIPADFEAVFFRFLAQIVKLIVYSVILQAANNHNIELGKKEWGLVFSVIGLSFAGIGLLNIIRGHSSDEDTPPLLCLESCLILIAAVCFYMTVRLNKTQRESEKFKLLSQQNEFHRQYAENVKKQYDDMRRIRHDIKQAYSVILTLLKDQKISEAFDFIQNSACRVADVEVLIDVGNDIINALLNEKLSAAKQQGIHILCNVDSRISDIDKVDLCNLLGNMLDNAVEACVRCEEGRRMIEVSIKSFGDKRLIEISNSVSGKVLEQNKLPKTTKADSELHGFGMKSICSIADKYRGSVHFVQEEDMFRCDVVLMQ